MVFADDFTAADDQSDVMPNYGDSGRVFTTGGLSTISLSPISRAKVGSTAYTHASAPAGLGCNKSHMSGASHGPWDLPLGRERFPPPHTYPEAPQPGEPPNETPAIC